MKTHYKITAVSQYDEYSVYKPSAKIGDGPPIGRFTSRDSNWSEILELIIKLQSVIWHDSIVPSLEYDRIQEIIITKEPVMNLVCENSTEYGEDLHD